MFSSPARLPTQLWLDAELAKLSAKGDFYYIVQKGNYDSGVVLLKILARNGDCALKIQQRDFDGKMGWIDALNQETIAETDAQAYIQRACTRDPDLWVVEVEQLDLQNPFEDGEL